MTQHSNPPEMSLRKKERVEKLKLGLDVRCINCNDKLTRIDDLYDGFCSERCKRVYKGIRKLSPKNLHHIVFWYYIQRKNEIENRTNKRSGRSLAKLIKQLDEVFP